MVDFIPLGPGNIPRGNAAPARGRTGKKSDESGRETSVYDRPMRAKVNAVPSPSLLSSLIEQALGALKQGVFWDRGTIVNLVL